MASLSRLSPSSKAVSRRGRETRWSTARADTASGGETIAPSAKQAAQGRLGTSQWVTSADGQRGEQDRADGEAEDARKVAAEAAEGGVIGAVHQQRRQEEDQRQLGIEGDRRQAGDEGQQAAADQQGGGGRQAGALRRPVKRDHHAEQRKDDFESFDRAHPRLFDRGWGRPPASRCWIASPLRFSQ